MYSSEKAFIMKFLAGLKKLGVTEIPYDNEEFNKGAENMQQYFQLYRNDLGRHSNEIAMLFLKNPMGGIFSEFREGIARQNGSLMSFDNPSYVCATIKLDDTGANYILEEKDLDITKEQIIEFSKAFCAGAGIILGNMVAQ